MRSSSAIKFNEFFSSILFEEKKEENNFQKEKRLKELYRADSIYFDSWRQKQSHVRQEEQKRKSPPIKNKEPSVAIKDFRVSDEYTLFAEQLRTIIFNIKSSFLERQKKEAIGSLLTAEDFKPLDELAARLLNPDIVSDIRKDSKHLSEAEIMYSDGKRYLEGLFYQVETAPFLSVTSVMKKLLRKQGEEKQESKNKSAITVCSSGTRQNLIDAYSELLGTTVDLGIDHALLTAVRANAYEFMKKTPPYSYPGNEIHDNAALTNYFYKELKMIPPEKRKIEDQYAHDPVDDDKIIYASTEYRARFRVKEADQFVAQANSLSLIQGFLDFLTHKFQKDMQLIQSYEGATVFLKNLLKLGGEKRSGEDIDPLRKRLFGYYFFR